MQSKFFLDIPDDVPQRNDLSMNSWNHTFEVCHVNAFSQGLSTMGASQARTLPKEGFEAVEGVFELSWIKLWKFEFHHEAWECQCVSVSVFYSFDSSVTILR